MKPKEALALIGGLSKPSKMPCFGWSISAFDCITGSKLAKHPNSVCHDCYARKGNYRYPVVENAHKNRILSFADPKWTDAMIVAIGHYSPDYFRFFDSGDLQSVKMLRKITEIAKALPETRFWLPTKETAIVRRANILFPDNLVVRVSGFTYNQRPTILPGSLTYTRKPNYDVFICPAYNKPKSDDDYGKCGDCRACWDNNIEITAFPKH